MATPKFDRCVRVNSRDVFIVKGDERIHIGNYAELAAWGNPLVMDVPESEVQGTKLVKEFKTRKTKAAPKVEEPEPEPEVEPEPEPEVEHD
jgi:hypothetical protein